MGGGGGNSSRYCPLLLSWSFLWLTFYSEYQAFLGEEKERSQTGRGESQRRENPLSLTPPSCRTEYVKGWGKVCVITNGKPVLTFGNVCSPYPPRHFFLISWICPMHFRSHFLFVASLCIFKALMYLDPICTYTLKRLCPRFLKGLIWLWSILALNSGRVTWRA